jgi:hypothetical protein
MITDGRLVRVIGHPLPERHRGLESVPIALQPRASGLGIAGLPGFRELAGRRTRL